MLISGRHLSRTPPFRKAYAFTLIELLAVVFVTTLVLVTMNIAGKNHDRKYAFNAAVLAGLAGVLLVLLLYLWACHHEKNQRAKLREKYRGIFRVKSLPANTRSIIKPRAAEIQIGDFGWEARPHRKDGLIHLQGLTRNWKVVWHAAFTPDEIEKVATKPVSQYDYFIPDWAEPLIAPPCPFPVLERDTPTMGRPSSSGTYIVNYPYHYYHADKDEAPI